MYVRVYIAWSWKTTPYYVNFFTRMISNFKYKCPFPPPRDGEKIWKWAEDFFFLFFFCHFLKPLKFVSGVPVWKFLWGKKSISHREKSGKLTLPPTPPKKNIPLTPLVLSMQMCTDLERGYGDVRPWRPLFHASPARVPFQAKESVHKTPFWENLEILASAASIFTQILAHKPPNLESFSSQAPKFGNFLLTSPPPPFQRQMSVRKPHT